MSDNVKDTQLTRTISLRDTATESLCSYIITYFWCIWYDFVRVLSMAIEYIAKMFESH